MIAIATIALLASGDAFSISNNRMRGDTSLQMAAGSKKKIVITGIYMHINIIIYIINIIIVLYDDIIII